MTRKEAGKTPPDNIQDILKEIPDLTEVADAVLAGPTSGDDERENELGTFREAWRLSGTEKEFFEISDDDGYICVFVQNKDLLERLQEKWLDVDEDASDEDEDEDEDEDDDE